MEERDNQRGKIYKAENEALETLKSELPTIADVRCYLIKQSKRATLVKRYGHAVDFSLWPLEIADGRGTRNALAYGTRKISIPLWARCDWVVLHEWAHVIHDRLSIRKRKDADRSAELRGGAAHGWQFAAIYLDLVRFCMGKEAGDALKLAFKKHRVRTKPKATRAVTPEMLERLRTARELKAA